MKLRDGLKVLAVAMLIANLAIGADSVNFSEPILLTTCGQSSDALMVKAVMTKDSLMFSYLPTATAADLEGKKSLLLVVGGSGKGLGAAKIKAEDEIERVSTLIEAAKAAKIPVIALHAGGMARRGDLSDPFNRLGAEHAQRIVVVKGGDDDQFFTKIAEEKKVPLESVDTVAQLGPTLRAMFRSSSRVGEAAKQSEN